MPKVIRGYRSEAELRHIVGAGVSAAAVWHLRDALDREGFHKVKIVASSGFDPAKCKVMAEAQAPIDIIGTGSFLPQRWTETYATADIIEYNAASSASRSAVNSCSANSRYCGGLAKGISDQTKPFSLLLGFTA